MTTSRFTMRRATAALLAAATLAVTVAPTAAQADRWRRHGGYYHGHHHHHGHGGAAAAAVGAGVLGLVAGAAIANSNRGEDCFVERRRFVDRYGRRGYRDIEVCE